MFHSNVIPCIVYSNFCILSFETSEKEKTFIFII